MNPMTYPRELRFRWYLQVEKHGQSVRDVCGIFGISRKTYYKWYALDHGRKRLPRGQQCQPGQKLTPEVGRLITREKMYTNYGPLKMKLLLQRKIGLVISTTVIYRYYKKHGLVRRPQKRLPWYTPLKDPVIPHQPGDVVQMDAKYVWQDNRRRYQRTFVDIYTGFHFAIIVDTLDAQTTIWAFQQAILYFSFPILGIQTDNGSENRGVFHQYLGQQGIAHYFIPKSSPNWDGAVERAHGVIDQEYYLNPHRPWHTLEEYLHWYNFERIHLGKYLNGLIPIEKLQQHQNKSTADQKVLPLTVN